MFGIIKLKFELDIELEFGLKNDLSWAKLSLSI